MCYASIITDGKALVTPDTGIDKQILPGVFHIHYSAYIRMCCFQILIWIVHIVD